MDESNYPKRIILLGICLKTKKKSYVNTATVIYDYNI